MALRQILALVTLVGIGTTTYKTWTIYDAVGGTITGGASPMVKPASSSVEDILVAQAANARHPGAWTTRWISGGTTKTAEPRGKTLYLTMTAHGSSRTVIGQEAGAAIRRASARELCARDELKDLIARGAVYEVTWRTEEGGLVMRATFDKRSCD